MAAFSLIDITEVHDEEIYSRYKERVPSELAAAGVIYLVRGGSVEVLEGSWRPERLVVGRFDSVEAARSWWHGPGYSELKAMRQRSTTTNMILVEGLHYERQ